MHLRQPVFDVLIQWSDAVSKSTKLQFGILIAIFLFVAGGYSLGKHLAKQDNARCAQSDSTDC